MDLTLRQCKDCTVGDAIGVAIVCMFIICIMIVIVMITLSLPYKTDIILADLAFFITSLFILFFNIGIPNELKGCLFFIQVNNLMAAL